MKTSRTFRLCIFMIISLIAIACGLLDSSDEVTDLENTVEALSDQLATETGEDTVTVVSLLPTVTSTIQPGDTIVSTPLATLQPTEPAFTNALELVGQYGGSSVAVAVKDHFAYLGQGPRLITLDVSNPASPKEVSRSELLPGIVLGVEVDEGYVYVTTGYSGLHIFDIRQPAAPQHIGEVEPDIPGCGAIVLQGDIAYMACNPSGLFIVDVSDPVTPQILSSGTFPGTMVSIAIQGEHVYLADYTRDVVMVISVADPRRPQQTGAFDVASIPSQSKVSVEALDDCNGQLCMAAGNHGLVVLDLGQPSNPIILGDQPQFWPSGIISEGNYAYLVDDLEGLRVFDISNPSQPQQVGLMPTSVGGFEFAVHEMKERGLYLADGKLYIPDQRYGLTIVDVSNPNSPTRIGQYMSPVPDVLTGIEVVDDLAYVISRSGGFRVLDVSDPENMVELSYDDARKNLNTQVPSGIEVIGNFAYISDQNYPFHVYDISIPRTPTQVSAVYDHAASSGADDLVISGNYAYLSGWGLQDALYPGAGIWVIDISNPKATKPMGFVDLPNEEWSLSIQGQTLYALDGVSDRKEPEPFALRILDISRPEKPVLVNSIVIPEFQPLFRSDVITSGERLYIALGFAGLKLFDISDPFNPVEVLMPVDSSLTSYASGLAIEGSTLFINSNMALDIKDPDAPNLLGIALEAIEAWTCDMEGDRVYIGTSFHGIWVYELVDRD